MIIRMYKDWRKRSRDAELEAAVLAGLNREKMAEELVESDRRQRAISAAAVGIAISAVGFGYLFQSLILWPDRMPVWLGTVLLLLCLAIMMRCLHNIYKIMVD